jgi:hypothetical protein
MAAGYNGPLGAVASDDDKIGVVFTAVRPNLAQEPRLARVRRGHFLSTENKMTVNK